MLSDSQEEVFSKRKLSSDDKSSKQDGSCIDIRCSGTILLSSLPTFLSLRPLAAAFVQTPQFKKIN
uniref:Uncharacterized protein n=1 Tax=Glossina palpalis gambiensis TaxID=67801 RepID=A0A1B0AUJ6_9MUSC